MAALWGTERERKGGRSLTAGLIEIIEHSGPERGGGEVSSLLPALSCLTYVII